jgi:hypothetical protein
MKYDLLFITVIISCSLWISCNTHNEEKPVTPVEIEDTVFESSTPAPDSNLHINNEPRLWQVDNTNGFKLQKPGVPGIETMAAKDVIRLINDNHDSIHLNYLKTSHDTIYVQIPHSEMLTERIGSTGADAYMASTTYSLTELKGIHYVNYDFKEGDHASPGVYSRDNFKKYQ